MYIIGDVHGCYDTLMKLLDKLPNWETEGLCFVGDLIDRGPKSRQVVEFVKAGGYSCVTGNHELMMRDWINSGCNYNHMLWLGNGGNQALDSYKETSDDEYLKGDVDFELLKEHAEWMSSLPIYLEFKELKKDDRHLVVSHSHISNVWKWRDSDEVPRQFHFEQEVTWGRPTKLKDTHEIFNVIGHTPVDGAKVKSFYANVDSGCFYTAQQDSFGHLTALKFPEMTLYTQDNIDEMDW